MAERLDVETQPVSPRDLESLGVADEPVTGERGSANGRSTPEPTPNSRKKFIWIAVLVVVAIFSVLVWRHYAGWESTDDAQIDGHIYPISARIAGHVIAVNVENNQYVEKGAVLAVLDPADYEVALDRAQAQLADAQASAQAARVGVPITSINTSSQESAAQAYVDTTEAGVAAAQKQVLAAEARLQEAEANNAKAQADLNRYRQLVGKQEVSEQQYDQAVAAAKAAAATVAAAEATVTAAEQQVAQAQGGLAQSQAQLRSTRTAPQQVAVTRARAAAADAAVKTAQAAVEQARLNLQYTTVVAPVSGIVGKKSVEAGQNVGIGQALMAIVPTEEIWVTANFKETQLRNMRTGQPAIIHVDAYNRDYSGHVLNIAGATGSTYSLLPPENATGNYVKVVQRVPVKILFDQGQDPNHLLRLGMSVEPRVKVE